MKLIIGGAFQGKLAYAKAAYPANGDWIDGRSCELKEIMTCGGIHHFHEYVRRILRGEEVFFAENLTELETQAELFVEELYRQNPDILVVSNELGCGIVPMEQFDREYRELVGRICTCLAARSDEVVRVVCGIGTRIK